MRCTQTELKRTKATTRRIAKGWWRCTIKIVSSSRIYTVDDAHAVVAGKRVKLPISMARLDLLDFCTISHSVLPG